MSLKLLSRIEIVCIILLMIIGSALVLSASSTYSALKYDSYYHLFTSHITKVVMAFGALFLFAFIPYELYKKISVKAIFGGILLLLITLVIAPHVKGAGRWINLGPISFQPSEVVKIILILHLAHWIDAKSDILTELKEGFIYPVSCVFIITGLIFIQPNVSVSMITLMLSYTMLFIGGARIKHLLVSLLAAGSVAGVFMMLFNHSRARILTFINSFHNGSEVNLQVLQAKIALGSGGLIGVGLGNSKQRDLFLPEAYGDFIFSILGEELGFFGAILVLCIYLVIFIAGIIIAKNAKDTFGQMLAFGLSFSILASAFINTAVVTGIFPTTGIPLPFISYGGTSILFTCASAGIIVNIALSTHKSKVSVSAK
jgi:cell division protein FtsW